MPPLVLDPPNNGVTIGASYSFSPVNAHGIHPATSLAGWRITVTTGQNNGGTLVTQSPWSTGAIATTTVNSLPANNNFYWTQIVYQKTTGGTWISSSNRFQSRP
jgi:hypothetical protein